MSIFAKLNRWAQAFRAGQLISAFHFEQEDVNFRCDIDYEQAHELAKSSSKDLAAMGAVAVPHILLAYRQAESVKSSEESSKWQTYEEKVRARNRALTIVKYSLSTLKLIRDSEALEPLIKLLDDESKDLVLAAIEALGEIGDPMAVDGLLKLAISGNSDGSGYANRAVLRAVEALGKIGDSRAVPSLIGLMKNSESGSEKLKAIDALGKIGGSTAVDELCKLVDESAGSWRVSVEAFPGAHDARERVLKAVGTLAIIGDTRAVPSLSRLARANSETEALAAIKALGKIGGPVVVEELLKRLDDRSEARAIQAAKSLAKIGDPRAVSALGFLAQNSNREDEVLAAIKALGKIGGPTAVDVILELVNDVDEAKRVLSKAMDALAKIGGARVISFLCSVARRSLERKAIAAIEALVEIGDSVAVDELLALVGDAGRPREVVSNAAEALVQIGDSRARDELLNLIASSEYVDDVGVTVGTLEKMGNPLAVTLLKTYAQNKAGTRALRKKALVALADLSETDIVSTLVEFAIDDDDDYLWGVASKLGRQHPDMYAPVLRSAFQSGRIGESLIDDAVFELVALGDDSANSVLPKKILDTIEKQKPDDRLYLFSDHLGVPREHVEIAQHALHFEYSITSDGTRGGGQVLDSYSGLEVEVIEKLCEIDTQFSSSVLFRVSKREDIEIEMVRREWGCMMYTETICLQRQRELARRELDHRGVGDSDPIDSWGSGSQRRKSNSA